MHKILVAIDGSDNAARALQFAITLATGSKGLTELHVLNVQPAITFGGVKKFISQEAIDAYYQEEAEKQMHAARQATRGGMVFAAQLEPLRRRASTSFQ